MDGDLYAVVKPSETFSGGYGLLDLPPWARESHRKNLDEIRRAHRRWRKKKREEAEKARLAAEQVSPSLGRLRHLAGGMHCS